MSLMEGEFGLLETVVRAQSSDAGITRSRRCVMPFINRRESPFGWKSRAHEGLQVIGRGHDQDGHVASGTNFASGLC